MFAELKSIKNNPGKQSAIFFFLLWNCSTLSECSRTDSLHCNPSLWGKNQLSHVRAGCSEDKPPRNEDRNKARHLCRGPPAPVPPQPFSSSLSWPRPRSPMEGTTDHPSTGQGLLEKPTKARDTQYVQLPTSGEGPWIKQLPQCTGRENEAQISTTAGPKPLLLFRKKNVLKS